MAQPISNKGSGRPLTIYLALLLVSWTLLLFIRFLPAMPELLTQTWQHLVAVAPTLADPSNLLFSVVFVVSGFVVWVILRGRKSSPRKELDGSIQPDRLKDLASYYESKASQYANLYFATVIGMYGLMALSAPIQAALVAATADEPWMLGVFALELLSIVSGLIIALMLGLHYLWYTDLASQAMSQFEVKCPNLSAAVETMVSQLRLPGYRSLHKGRMWYKLLLVAASYFLTILLFWAFWLTLVGINPAPILLTYLLPIIASGVSLIFVLAGVAHMHRA